MNIDILLIDDNKISRLSSRRIIEGLQSYFDATLTVREAEDGVTGIVLLEQHTDICIAFIDMNMPGLLGTDLIAAIQEKRPNLPIVLLTANVQSSIQKRAEQLNVKFMAKPATKENLLSALKNHILINNLIKPHTA